MYPGGSWHEMKEGRQQQLKLGLGSLIFNFLQCLGFLLISLCIICHPHSERVLAQRFQCLIPGAGKVEESLWRFQGSIWPQLHQPKSAKSSHDGLCYDHIGLKVTKSVLYLSRRYLWSLRLHPYGSSQENINTVRLAQNKLPPWATTRAWLWPAADA